MKHSPSSEPQNQNLIEALGVTPEEFNEVVEDVKSHPFTSIGYLEEHYDLSDEEAEIYLIELQDIGVVAKENIGGSFGVYPDGVESRELTKRRKIMTSKLGRSIIKPIVQSTTEVSTVTAGKVARIVTAAPLREMVHQNKINKESREEAEKGWKESYQQRVVETTDAGGLDPTTKPRERKRQETNAPGRTRQMDPRTVAIFLDNKAITPEEARGFLFGQDEHKTSPAEKNRENESSVQPEVKGHSLSDEELRAVDERIGAKISDYIRESSDRDTPLAQKLAKARIRSQIIAEFLGQDATEEKVAEVQKLIRDRLRK